jgi:hypothetical protein
MCSHLAAPRDWQWGGVGRTPRRRIGEGAVTTAAGIAADAMIGAAVVGAGSVAVSGANKAQVGLRLSVAARLRSAVALASY